VPLPHKPNLLMVRKGVGRIRDDSDASIESVFEAE
jgi:hypothetical protein